jgi:hypothetical protein
MGGITASEPMQMAAVHDGPTAHVAALPATMPTDDDMHAVICVLATGLRRVLARQHGWNESLNPREGLLGVALGDQAGISADAPANGAKETA